MNTLDHVGKAFLSARDENKLSILRMRALDLLLAVDYECVLHQAPFREMQRVKLGEKLFSNLVHYKTFLLPVVDLRRAPGTRTNFLNGDCFVAQVKGRLITVLVDSIIDVLTVERQLITDILLPPEQTLNFLVATIEIQEMPVLLVDLGALFDREPDGIYQY